MKTGNLKKPFAIWKSWRQPDVWMNIRHYIGPEYLAVLAIGILGCLILGWLFYDSLGMGLLMTPCNIWVLRIYEKKKQEYRMRILLDEFKELLQILTANLKAGYSLEHAWITAEKDFRELHTGDSRMGMEAQKIVQKVALNIPIEQAVYEFGEEIGQEDILSFAEVLRTAKRSGGNLVHIIENTTTIIAEKIEIGQEIRIMLSGKRLEQRIMCGMPIFMLLYLRMGNPGYLDVLYHNVTGGMIMSGCMLGTVMASYWGSRIMRIEV